MKIHQQLDELRSQWAARASYIENLLGYGQPKGYLEEVNKLHAAAILKCVSELHNIQILAERADV